MIDIKTLGAGGGSIAWIDRGGGLQVGPRSAGADPGPACYGRGGEEPAVTDANLVLGYLNPDYFLGGEMKLDADRARRAVEERIARPLGLSVGEAAAGIFRVVNAEMIRGIRLVSVERGFDPRQFSLMCFGGAGPVHAVKLAQELSIPRIIVPHGPGVTCALGLLMADFRHDFSRTFFRNVARLAPEALSEVFSELEARALDQMRREDVPEAAIRYERGLDMRYAGQGYELEIAAPRQKHYSRQDLTLLCERFTRSHTEQYGYGMPVETVEIVNVRLVATGLLPKPDIAREEPRGTDASPAFKGERRAQFDGALLGAPLYERTRLRCGNEIPGPAIIEQLDSTTVVWPGYLVTVDPFRNLIITRDPPHDREPAPAST
jgi:N-methylhydantoinase A